MKNLLNKLIVWVFCGFLFVPSLCANNKAPLDLRLISGGSENGHVVAGLLLTIPKKWHVYGPTPSGVEAAGFEPTINSEASLNLQDVKILWPLPHKTMIQDQLSYVYEGETLIPINLIPKNIKAPLALTLKVSLLACSDVCVPHEETLTLRLSPGEAKDPLFKLKEETLNEAIPLLTLLSIALLGGFYFKFYALCLACFIFEGHISH